MGDKSMFCHLILASGCPEKSGKTTSEAAQKKGGKTKSAAVQERLHEAGNDS